MTQRERSELPIRKEVKDLARSEFESAMSFGVSLDNFMRLGVACYEAGAKAMQDQSDYWKSLYERERDLYDRQTKTLAGAAAERAVSDKLLEALKALIQSEHDGIHFCASGLPIWEKARASIAEVEATRKEQE